MRNLRQTDGLLFGNDVIEVNFDEKHCKKEFLPPGFGIEYSFTLEDAVTDCKESLVPFVTFAELAKEYDLEIMRWTNFHQYVHEMLNLPKEGKYRSVHELWLHLMQPPGGSPADGKSLVPRNAERSVASLRHRCEAFEQIFKRRVNRARVGSRWILHDFHFEEENESNCGG